jgi:hypothetical protein
VMISCSFDMAIFFDLLIATHFAGVQSSEVTVEWYERR